MQHRFFALISRMRYIGRWGLMRNTFEENIQEHSHMVPRRIVNSDRRSAHADQVL